MSDQTREKFGATLFCVINDLRDINMSIQRIDQLSRRHVIALTTYWCNALGHAPSTVQNKLSVLRKFCILTGRGDVVPKGSVLRDMLLPEGVGPDALTREQVTSWSKTWSSSGVDPHAVIDRIRQQDPQEALLMETMLAWGLRVSEALGLRPYGSEEPDGLLVHRETKGGRWRKVRYMSDPEQAAYQRDVLSRCKSWVQGHRALGMGYAGMTLKQARKRFYNTMAKHGVSLNELGVVCHGLRHEFASNLFFDITGHRPPAEGQEPSKWFVMNRDIVRDAYRQVSEALGHWRIDISGAYLGSALKMSKGQKQRIEKTVSLIAGTPSVAAGLRAAGVDRLWITGRAAVGVELHGNEPVLLSLYMKPDTNLAEQLERVQGVLAQSLAIRTALLLQFTEVPPDDAVEVFLDSRIQ
ncbi:tyrosine-type recombinase/integrase [Calothrix sp. FACHB-1219]|nr:tyrosine-type recombinase/integrase [Calothrix sp. FACHB-1219]